MKTTLAERLKEAMIGPPQVSGVALAQACGVKPPSVSGWRTGDSKTLEGHNLLAAAKYLRVRPEWLADGVGPKHQLDRSIPTTATAHHASEKMLDSPWAWPFKLVKPAQYALLDDDQKIDVEKYIMLQVKTRAPPEKQSAPGKKTPIKLSNAA